MKRQITIMAVLLVAVVCAAAPLRSQRIKKPNQVEDFMHAKLEHAQKVLEALAKEDFPAMAKHSQELALLSQAAQWQVLQTREYQRHSGEFRRQADALTKAGQSENLDGAVLAYMQMTLNCVNCHKHVRNTRVGGLNRIYR